MVGVVTRCGALPHLRASLHPGVSLSGQLVDESGVNPLVAALCRVPVVLITGDQHAAVQAAPLRPGAETVVVKQSLTRRAARNLHQVAARRLI